MSIHQALYPIREVSEQTGVNSVTLRAWQRRFGLLNPQRTAKGHRLYSEQDIARVHDIVSWLEKGVPISQVKPLLEQQPSNEVLDNWQQQMELLLAASFALKASKLNQLLDQLTSLYPYGLVMNKVLIPWLKQCDEDCVTRADGTIVMVWLQQQIKQRFYTRLQLANQTNQGLAVWLLQVGERPWWQLLLQANEWALAGYRVTTLHLPDLTPLPLVMDRIEANDILFDLPAQVTTNQKQLFNQLGSHAYLTGEFAVLHQVNLGLKVADCRQPKEAWQ
ncbi:MerR family transcriptional regulator [Motilimonas sp. 1_MG-2023]|uniref:MerR family transcriptional regulator n=1 Tax=Motilimonas sp. 1_MG-2023 TaxID=3062672 RepID=UPI0026E465B9|nr:MerR family transcriptional regulator [Motilimonas sp. 1_MG-2023]MDO6526075.1 MerR family transcriptional regulator [Motilimonas sp. 1_MG-2023]